ncbi:MAG: hypothetical protein ACK4WH_02550 [Phycisphaerales bacterium]
MAGLAMAPIFILGTAMCTLIIPMRMGWKGFPPWIGGVGVALCIAVLIGLALRVWLFTKKIEASDGFLCLNCHYDLHGLPDSGDCPECGEMYERDRLERLWSIWLLDHSKYRKHLQPRRGSLEEREPIPKARGPNLFALTMLPVAMLGPVTLGSVTMISRGTTPWWAWMPLWIGLPALAAWNARRVWKFHDRLKDEEWMVCPRCRKSLNQREDGAAACPVCGKSWPASSVRTAWDRFMKRH